MGKGGMKGSGGGGKNVLNLFSQNQLLCVPTGHLRANVRLLFTPAETGWF